MKRALLAIFLVSCTATAVAARVEESKITGMFSNLEYNKESGDLLGIEIYLVYGGRDYFAIVQCAGGSPAPPVVTPVEISGTEITFKIPEVQPECGTTFTGTVSKEGLRGRFMGDTAERWIPRKKGYWE
jgi:hypothetical protein